MKYYPLITSRLIAIFIIMISSHVKACHFVIKGLACTLRENVFRTKRDTHRMALNSLIHCPSNSNQCVNTLKHAWVLYDPLSMEYYVQTEIADQLLIIKHGDAHMFLPMGHVKVNQQKK